MDTKANSLLKKIPECTGGVASTRFITERLSSFRAGIGVEEQSNTAGKVTVAHFLLIRRLPTPDTSYR